MTTDQQHPTAGGYVGGEKIPDFFLYECGCGTRTFISGGGGTLNACACSAEERRATMTIRPLVFTDGD